MKNKLLGMGLASLIGLIGTNASALEVNVNGYAVPDKTNTEVIEEREFSTILEDNKTIIRTIFKRYVKPDGSSFNELTINDRTIAYRMFFDKTATLANSYAADIANSYVIEDANCDGIFETRYEGTEEVLKPLPECYKK